MRFRTCLEHQTGGRGIVKSLAFATSHLQISKSIVTCVLPVQLGVWSGDVSFRWRHSQSIDHQTTTKTQRKKQSSSERRLQFECPLRPASNDFISRFTRSPDGHPTSQQRTDGGPYDRQRSSALYRPVKL